ncbi:MAG: hypothetical protein WKI04_00230 [Ferruginibacter sp.]
MNHRININRVKGVLKSIPKYFLDLQVALPKSKDTWYGFRPCSPEGLPYIGYSQKMKLDHTRRPFQYKLCFNDMAMLIAASPFYLDPSSHIWEYCPQNATRKHIKWLAQF